MANRKFAMCEIVNKYGKYWCGKHTVSVLPRNTI